MLLTVDANFLAGFNFAAHVNLRRRVVAGEDDGEAGAHSGGSHGFYFHGHFAADVAGDLRAVEDSGRHIRLAEILSHGRWAKVIFTRERLWFLFFSGTLGLCGERFRFGRTMPFMIAKDLLEI